MDHALTWMLTTAIGSLAIGIGAGFYLGRSTTTDARRTQELERELDATTKDFAAFRKQVAQHFAGTAELTRDLTARQRLLNEHLAQGAHSLAGQIIEDGLAPPPRPTLTSHAAPREVARPHAASGAERPRHPAMVAPADFPRI
ncbi:MAG: hypothetical protein B7Z66_05920 [Chromatiales bacterium 21-64-14]|nr:MAG: hypothetical protein B7Z66_05920 [Chromatiales bacterium 21-64-14]HQU15159.1 DUF1043 family protein [Gammaproteobacteria bacterium]